MKDPSRTDQGNCQRDGKGVFREIELCSLTIQSCEIYPRRADRVEANLNFMRAIALQNSRCSSVLLVTHRDWSQNSQEDPGIENYKKHGMLWSM
jgi:hypothetical protein